eukprot:Tamp_08944.p3 GENE.Tamp_08944~~Tamp_08944.p3  ORF type:complete len:147 (+),score=33.30 Tamp_08944:1178-1618(+)
MSFSQKNKATAQTRYDQVYSQVLAIMYRITSVPRLPSELREREMQDIQQIIDKLSLETDDISLHAQMEGPSSTKRQRLDEHIDADDASPSGSQDSAFVSSLIASSHDSPMMDLGSTNQDAPGTSESQVPDWLQGVERISDSEDETD